MANAEGQFQSSPNKERRYSNEGPDTPEKRLLINPEPTPVSHHILSTFTNTSMSTQLFLLTHYPTNDRVYVSTKLHWINPLQIVGDVLDTLILFKRLFYFTLLLQQK